MPRWVLRPGENEEWATGAHSYCFLPRLKEIREVCQRARAQGPFGEGTKEALWDLLYVYRFCQLADQRVVKWTREAKVKRGCGRYRLK